MDQDIDAYYCVQVNCFVVVRLLLESTTAKTSLSQIKLKFLGQISQRSVEAREKQRSYWHFTGGRTILRHALNRFSFKLTSQ